MMEININWTYKTIMYHFATLSLQAACAILSSLSMFPLLNQANKLQAVALLVADSNESESIIPKELNCSFKLQYKQPYTFVAFT